MPSSEGSVSKASSARSVLYALACLYTAQGIPYGFATEYLPVALREEGYSYTGIAAVAWLQLPWQLKILWAKGADHPRLRPRARPVILVMQLALTATVATFAVRPLHAAPSLWFVLTAVAAALAATQDVFVDAFAVRALAPSERGFGNTAQVAGYRVGMLVGGAALLVLASRIGERSALVACAALIAAASIGAFAAPSATDPGEKTAHASLGMRELGRHVLRREALAVLLVAATFKLGLHMASPLLKPMAVDYGWTKAQIGVAVVTFGTGAALAGSVAGGVLHRAIAEKKALALAAVLQAIVCVPLVAVDRMHAPIVLTTAAIAIEHFVSGLGTTVLFAALMSATRPADAGLHYTVLTSANGLAIGLGAPIGGLLADHAGKSAAFVAAAIVCAVPLALLRGWDEAARASRT